MAEGDLRAFLEGARDDVARSVEDVGNKLGELDDQTAQNVLDSVRRVQEADAAGAEAARAPSEDLYAFGNRSGPRLPRPEQDFGVSGPGDQVGPFSPASPQDNVSGASTFTDPTQAPLTGQYHKLPADTLLPEGLGVHADGRDVGGTHGWGHRTIYPAERMSVAKFQELFGGLPWTWAGKK